MAASSQVNNSQCYFSNFCNVSCSTSKELEESNLLSLHECDKNTSYHLAGLQASERIPGKNAQFYDCPEALLILYRCGIFTIDPRSLDLKICQKHREYFGIRWRRSKTRCSYPEHNGQKSRGDRGANPSLCKEYWLKTRSTLQVGTGICKHCQQFFRSNISEEFKVDFKDEIESFFQVKKLIKKNFAEEICEVTGSQDESMEDLQSCCTEHSEASLSQTTSESSADWIETHMTDREKLNNAMKMLSTSFVPLKCQLSKPWNSLGKSTKSFYLKKSKECIDLVLGIIAPGQEDEVLNTLFKKGSDIQIDSTTQSIIDAYQRAQNSRTQTQILSLIVNNYTKVELQTLIPGLSVSKIDNARKQSLVVGAGKLVTMPKIYRTRLTKPKLAHFVDFVMNPLFSTVVGFDQTVLKLSTSEKMEIPRVIRNVINARIISNYQLYCQENNFEPFSRPTLYRILKVCGASKQKVLHGLDNITSAGMASIDTLLTLLSKLETLGVTYENVKKLQYILHVVNQFLKFEYKLHLNKLDGCPDHCTTYALSDPSDSDFAADCDHQHDIYCDKCNLTEKVVNLIQQEIENVEVPESVQDDINYDLLSASKNLMEWKRHMVRIVHQDGAKSDILKNLAPNQCMIIMDWAMKFIPFQFRETQSNFFGKRGLSWHISCVVTKFAEHLDLHCFIHILENGTQGWFSIANILVHLLEHLKLKEQSLEEAYIKSDNAACYHCVNLLAFIQLNNSSFPIRVNEYNFSEAQSGKDLCDSKTGSARLHIFQYANEGHDVQNTNDMKTALDSYGGLKGTNTCIVSIDQKFEPKVKCKIPAISVLNNFSFTESGILARKAYKIGQGKLVPPSAISDPTYLRRKRTN